MMPRTALPRWVVTLPLLLGSLLVLGCGQEPLSDVEGLEPRAEAVTCSPVINRFPVNAAHNTGFDWTSCPSGTSCNLYCPPTSQTVANDDYHGGHDIFANRGAPVVAAQDGIVSVSFTDSAGGNVVYVKDNCGWYHYYAHLDTVTSGLYIGQSVTAGTQIGTVGNTGNASGTSPHLHYGAYNESWSPTNVYNGLYNAEPTSCSTTTQPPPKVTGLSPANWATVSTEPVNMTWGAASGATSYSVYVLYWNGSQWVNYNTYSASSSSLAFYPAYDKTYYAWSVTAKNSAGSAPASDFAYFYWTKPAAPTVPPQVTGLSPDGWANAGSSSVTLRWNAAAGATSYEVYIMYWTGSQWAYYYTYYPTTNYVTYWPQRRNTNYAWNVKAKNSAGTGPQSAWAYFYYQ